MYEFFFGAARIIKDVVVAAKISKIHLIGHSMGGLIATVFAAQYPERTGRIVQLSTSYRKYKFFSSLGLTYRFVASGAALQKERSELLQMSGQEDYLQPLIDYNKKQESMLKWGRWEQRLAEFGAICKADLAKYTRWLDNSIPVMHLSGMEDTVFPPTKELPIVEKAARMQKVFETVVLNGLKHNPTLFQSEITAAAIAHFLETDYEKLVAATAGRRKIIDKKSV